MDIQKVDESMTEVERAQVTRASELWKKKSEGRDFEEWLIIGTELARGRQHIMRMLYLNAPKGRPYNEWFSAWCERHGFGNMEPSLRSNLLWLLDAENFAAVRKLREAMSQSDRMRINHPTSMKQKVIALQRLYAKHDEIKAIGEPKAEDLPKEPAENPKAKIARLEAEIAEMKSRNGSLFDLKRTPPADIGRTIVNHVSEQKWKAIKEAAEARIIELRKKGLPAG